jgi:hypothetical protein
MTRKDYVALAEAFSAVQPRPGIGMTETAFVVNGGRDRWRGWEDAMRATADVLAADNPRFDRARFIKACQGEK